MKKVSLLIVLLSAALILVGCGGGGGNNNTLGEPPVTGSGAITGSVFAPDQTTPIVGAIVTVEGTGRTTTTNAQGAYSGAPSSPPSGVKPILRDDTGFLIDGPGCYGRPVWH